ncbi:threonine/serine dehydratase [Echinicola strongylocentroti]|uniref:Threonine/serine dehydratase n=1 Tax=Echinicola strongylocentroti TaxID=1795355 RepID=A0A2Z4IJA8_9BACT|nr:pyridoxal-phosphate dependent enzyme [Echinicola strongylocentroti]AWW30780.1 threonine/serine dehydratase [Echinicola strongylocentroti]
MQQTFRIPQLIDIKQAYQRIMAYIHHTPIITCEAIDNISGSQLYFKCENFQKVGAFKARGATNAILKLPPELKQNGVATHSSGNHAAALARAAKETGTNAYIVMPSSAPAIKKAAVKHYGGKIIECEPTLKAREATLEKVVEETGAAFIPPYDYMDVIEGQATCVLEMWDEGIPFDAIITPVGGGGLLAGTALTTHYLSPKTPVYGAEPKGADDAHRSLKANRIMPMDNPDTIADGLLTSLGQRNFTIISKHVEDIFTVSDEEIIAAMRLVFERMKIVIEPSSAVPLAVVLANKALFENKRVGLVFSGGNVDVSKLPFK